MILLLLIYKKPMKLLVKVLLVNYLHLIQHMKKE